MNEMLGFDKPTRVICHFKQDQDMSEQHGTRIVRYQALIDNNELSPSGEFIRFNNSQECEIHGWIPVVDIIIDEVLEAIEAKKEAA